MCSRISSRPIALLKSELLHPIKSNSKSEGGIRGEISLVLRQRRSPNVWMNSATVRKSPINSSGKLPSIFESSGSCCIR